jgi:hypothetical protein
MTHTLHRKGDAESLKEDYILMLLADRKINYINSSEKMRRIWEVISHYQKELVNFGNLDGGNCHETTLGSLMAREENQYAHAVFMDRESLKSCLKELKENDFGISTVVSGLYLEILKICGELEICPHTVEISLGIKGNTDLLPEEEILEVTTMCGHHMISPELVREKAVAARKGKITSAKAAEQLSKICGCGIFNPRRAEKLLTKIQNEHGS